MQHLDLLERLTDGARDAGERAALVVLTNLPYVFGRPDVVDRWYSMLGNHMIVEWRTVAEDVEHGGVPLSDGERAALRVAASMAIGWPANLRDVFRHLDPQVAGAIIAALYALDGGGGALVNDHARFAGQADR